MNKVINKITAIMLSFSMVSAFSTVSAKAEEAVPTASTVLINGQNVKFDAYLINDNNYFKLRDLAYVLNATEKQFSVNYNEVLNLVSLTSGEPYTAVGGELASGVIEALETHPSTSEIMKDGNKIELRAYLVNGNNYFKLRDIGELFNFGVEWDGDNNTISIDTSKRYIDEPEEEIGVNNTYYSDYTPGDTIELGGVVDNIEEFRGTAIRNEDFVITASFTDYNGNKWIVPLNVDIYGVSHMSEYIPYIGRNVTITGTYEGFSKWYELPCVTTYELKDQTTDKKEIGIREAAEILSGGVELRVDEPVFSVHGTLGIVEAWLRGIKEDMIDDLMNKRPNK